MGQATTLAATIRQVLDDLRNVQGVPYSAIAGLLGVNVSTLRRWARGDTIPDDTMLWRLYVLQQLAVAQSARDLHWA